MYVMIISSNNVISNNKIGPEYTDCISVEGYDSPNENLGYDTKQSDYEITGALGNAEYPFIAIAPWSTLARSGST